MRSKQSAALVSAPAAAAADCLEQHVHNTISVDLSHVLGTPASPVRYAIRRSISPPSNPNSVFSRGTIASALASGMVLALVLALASATACGHIRKPVSLVVVHARSPSTWAALPPTPRGGIAVAVFLPPEFFSPLCYEPFSPATRAMDTTICYNIDQTFRGALMLGGAAFTVLSGVSCGCVGPRFTTRTSGT